MKHVMGVRLGDSFVFTATSVQRVIQRWCRPLKATAAKNRKRKNGSFAGGASLDKFAFYY